MIVVMKSGADKRQVEHVAQLVREMGLKDHVIVGTERTVVAVIGDDRFKDRTVLESVEGGEKVVPLLAPYKMASREVKRERSVVPLLVHGKPGATVPTVGGIRIGVMAGPCSVESKQQTLEIAHAVKEAGAVALRGGAFKPRTSPYAFQGLGRMGLELLAEARATTGLPVVSEVVDPADVELFDEHVDLLQVGARNMQNFSLLKAAGQSRRPVLLKRGLSATIEEWLLAAEYVLAAGNPNVILCERGIRTFETATRNTLDLSAIPVLRARTHLPIMVDPSHGTGQRALVGPMALAGAAVGADGLLIEVHPDPPNARSDGDQSLPFDEFGALMDELRRLQFVRSSADARPAAVDERPVVASGIDELRDRIDDTDARLADLVQERAALALEVQRRRDPDAHGHDVRRERDLLERAANGASGPMTPVELTMVFDAVLRASRSVQRRHAQAVAPDQAAAGTAR